MKQRSTFPHLESANHPHEYPPPHLRVRVFHRCRLRRRTTARKRRRRSQRKGHVEMNNMAAPVLHFSVSHLFVIPRRSARVFLRQKNGRQKDDLEGSGSLRLVRLWVLILLLAPDLARAEEPLDSAARIHALSAEEADRSLPVRLGRALPLHEDAGARRGNKFDGIFYFNWQAASTVPPFNNTKLLAANPFPLLFCPRCGVSRHLVVANE